MEDTLYYSSLCRLCAEENKNGIPLFEDSEEESELRSLINKYLPLKVDDDYKLPRTICPGCNIQLEATVQFLDLVVGGQMILRDMVKAENEALKKDSTNDEDKIVVHIIDDGQIYSPDHAITLRVEGLDKPKRKRGRPKKSKPDTTLTPPEQLPTNAEETLEDTSKDESTETGGRKRRRKAPQRFKEAVQGKELERIFREEGVIDESESESDQSSQVDPSTAVKKSTNPENWEDEVIGHMETPDGNPLGQLVIVNKAKGRGRPKGKSRTVRQTCTICLLEFTSLGRYMAHVAAHHCKLETPNAQSENTLEFTTEDIPLEQNILQNDNLESQCPENFFADDNECDDSQVIDSTVVVKSEDLGNTSNLLRVVETTPVVQMSEILPEINAVIKIDKIDGVDDVQTVTTEMVKKTDGIKFKCTQCDKLFNSKQSCEVHTKAAHLGHRPFKCEQCGKTFPYQVSLKQHMLIHFPKGHRGYACDLCGKVLSHPSSVIYHKEAEHNSRRFVCNKCGRAFKHRQLLQRHQLVHSENRPFVCKICNASFKTKANLINHQPTHTGVKKFTCGVCYQPFAHKASLTLHLRWHAGEKPYSCTVCGKSFSQNGNLAEHMRIHTGEKPYMCVICQRAFTTSSQHRLHLQRHSGEKPWQCADCGKRFLNKETWRVHARRHRGERPFACTDCDRSFTESWALRKHQRTHSGERPYSCNICGRTFADCSNLTKHKKIHRQPEELAPVPEVPNDDNTLTILGDVGDPSDGRVVYVTYQTTTDNDVSSFHIINEDSHSKALGECDLYTAERLDDETVYEQNHEGLSTTIFDQVTDEDGNPLHFTMQDGTQLAITSSDGGKSLQVTTHDGQTIPVQLSDKLDEDDENMLKEVILGPDIVDDTTTEDLMQPIRVLPSGQVRFLATLDDNMSYFTFGH